MSEAAIAPNEQLEPARAVDAPEPQPAEVRTPTAPTLPARDQPLTPAVVISLQQTAGNAKVTRYLESAGAGDGDELDLGPRMRASSRLLRAGPSSTTSPAADAGTARAEPPPSPRVGGDLKSKKVVYIAWTFDDGPSAATPAMEGVAAGIAGTWYVDRQMLGKGTAYTAALEKLKRKQDQGQEIAIHGVDPDLNHRLWFPPAHPSLADAFKSLDKFRAELAEKGITVKMVRLPTGLYTELMRDLRFRGKKGKEEGKEEVLRPTLLQIIRGETGPDSPKDVLEVVADLKAYREGLKSRGLREEGGETVSWEAESSPPVPEEVKKAAEAKGRKPPEPMSDTATGVAKKKITDTAKDGAMRSAVILAHDTPYFDKGSSYRRPAEVKRDIDEIEAFAGKLGVRIEYKTMSELFPEPTPEPASAPDAGTPAAPEAGTPAAPDAGIGRSLARVTLQRRRSVMRDAGVPATDAGVPAKDAGVPATDAGVPAASAASDPKSLTISAEGLAFIAQYEKFMAKLYDDQGGNCTIGYGHLVHHGKCSADPAKNTDEAPYAKGITKADALVLLKTDADKAVKEVQSGVTVKLTQAQFDVLVSLTFNIGVTAFRRSDLRDEVNKGNHAKVLAELKKWNKVDNKPSAGLTTRRQAEAARWGTAAAAPDAGTPKADAGTPKADAGTPKADAGTPPADAGTK